MCNLCRFKVHFSLPAKEVKKVWAIFSADYAWGQIDIIRAVLNYRPP